MKTIDIFLTMLLSAGALQGLIYGFILLKKATTNRAANSFLATILFFFSYRLIVEICKIFGYGFYDFWYHIFIEFNWIYGALIYFFVKASVVPQYSFKLKKEWIHFLPVTLEFVWSNFIKTQNFYWDGTRESLSWLGYYGYIIWMHYPTMFIISGALIIYYSTKANNLIKHQTLKNHINKSDIKWINQFLIVLKYFAVILIIVVLTDLIFFDYAFQKFYSYPLFIGMAIITYWLGLEGFNKRNIDVIKTQKNISEQERSQFETIAKRLQKLMSEEKLYLNPDLNLTKLAEALEEKSYLVSKSLNVILNKKFNDFVNEYRINALKIALKNPENSKFTLLSLAFEVGFNSKASFNRAVKKITGKPPKDLKSNP